MLKILLQLRYLDLRFVVFSCVDFYKFSLVDLAMA